MDEIVSAVGALAGVPWFAWVSVVVLAGMAIAFPERVAMLRGKRPARAKPAPVEVDDEIALEFGEQLLGACAVAAMAIDYDSRVRLWNGGAEELTGWKAEAVLGQAVEVIMPAEIARRHAGFVRSYLDRYRAGGPRLAGDVRRVLLKHHDGHEVAVLVRLIHLNRGSQIIFAWVTPATLEE